MRPASELSDKSFGSRQMGLGSASPSVPDWFCFFGQVNFSALVSSCVKKKNTVIFLGSFGG